MHFFWNKKNIKSINCAKSQKIFFSLAGSKIHFGLMLCNNALKFVEENNKIGVKIAQSVALEIQNCLPLLAELSHCGNGMGNLVHAPQKSTNLEKTPKASSRKLFKAIYSSFREIVNFRVGP